MKELISIILVFHVLTTSAQDGPWQHVLHERVPADLYMSAQLYQVARLQQEAGAEETLQKIQEFGGLTDEQGRLYVEFASNYAEQVLKAEQVRSLGMEPEIVWRNIASAYVEIDQLIPVARRIDGLGRLEFVSQHGEDFQGADVQNSNSYISNGKDGSGITIGLIDKNYGSLSAAIGMSAVPNQPGQMDTLAFPANNSVEINGRSDHGTACLEVLFDNAPGANYVVCRINGDAAFGSAVDSLIALGVDVISTSSAEYNEGWDDDIGPWAQAWNNACNAGILCFNSAGNAAQEHWEGNFNDFGNSTHQWNNFGDTTNGFSLDTSRTVNVYLQWDDPSPGNEYDLFLYRSDGTLIGSSMASSGFEQVSFTNNLPTTVNLDIVVRSNVPTPPIFEVFAANENIEHRIITGSTRAPSNATHANALSVGAVRHTRYDTLPGSLVIENYSSRGPTNSGNQAPDITGPTNVTTFTSDSAFGGTSCATPNAAGAAAAFWSAHPFLSADGVRQIILRKAELFKDWGGVGVDMTYGHGGLYLKDHTANTYYVLKNSGNPGGGDLSLPFNSIQQADTDAPVNSQVWFMGETFNIPTGGVVLTGEKVYRSLVEDTVFE